MDEIAETMLSLLSETHQQNLLEGLSKQASWTLGSICSGTDVCSMAASALLLAVRKLADKKTQVPDFLHVFSCEINKAKQDFLRQFVGPRLVFEDAAAMGSQKAHDVISNTLQYIPAVDCMIAGFVCKDVSHMNRHACSSKSCISEASKRTGRTFQAVLQYCERHRPGVVILENVTAIEDIDPESMQSNAEVCCSLLQGLGYQVFTKAMTPQLHGVPHRRNRFWFVALLMSYDALAKEAYTFSQPMWNTFQEALDSITLTPPMLPDFVLGADDAELRLWQQHRLEMREKTVKAEELAASQASQVSVESDLPDDCEWPELHKSMFRSNKKRYPVNLRLIYDSKQLAALQVLPQRQREIVAFWDLTKPPPPDEEEVLDLAQGISRTPNCQGSVPCILPNSVLWLRRAFRLLEPSECLCMQALPLLPFASLQHWSTAEIMSLAGNAFCGANVMALLLASFVAYERQI